MALLGLGSRRLAVRPWRLSCQAAADTRAARGRPSAGRPRTEPSRGDPGARRPQRRRCPDRRLTSYDARDDAERGGARAARRQGPLAGAAVTGRSLVVAARAPGLARVLARPVRDEDVAVRVLRYRTVGWNGDGADRIADARWALDRVRDELGRGPGRAGRPLDGRPYGVPRRRRRRWCAASWRWRPGCRRASRSRPWPASSSTRPTAAATTSPGPTTPGPTSSGPRAVAERGVVHRHGRPRPLPAPRHPRLERLHRSTGYAGSWLGRSVRSGTSPESSSGVRMKLSCFIRPTCVTVRHGTKPFRFIQMNDR